MTNQVVVLSNQIVLLEKHIVNLEANNLALSNYIKSSISHTEFIGRLDTTIAFSSFIAGSLTLIATIVVGISIFRLFNVKREEEKVKQEIIDDVSKSVLIVLQEHFDKLSESLNILYNTIPVEQNALDKKSVKVVNKNKTVFSSFNKNNTNRG